MASLVLEIASHFACLSCLPILYSYFTLRLTSAISTDLTEWNYIYQDKTVCKLQLVCSVTRAPFRQISNNKWWEWCNDDDVDNDGDEVGTIMSSALLLLDNCRWIHPKSQQVQLYAGGQKFLHKSHRKSESKEINDLMLHTMKLAKTNTPFTFLTKQNCNVRLSQNKSPPRAFMCKMREMNA